MPRLTKALKEQLLTKLRSGHELSGAAAALGLTEQQIEAAGPKLAGEVETAYKTGSARLRARLLELSLSKEDGAALARLLDRREQQVADGPNITRIERVIIEASCPSCGYRPPVAPSPPRLPPRRRSNGKAPT